MRRIGLPLILGEAQVIKLLCIVQHVVGIIVIIIMVVFGVALVLESPQSEELRPKNGDWR